MKFLKIKKFLQFHKELVLKKYKEVIISYVLVGSFATNKALKESDIDILIIVDNLAEKFINEIKKKSFDLGLKICNKIKLKHKLDIQIYTLNEFWNLKKEINPIMLNYAKQGIDLFDRGEFIRFKQEYLKKFYFLDQMPNEILEKYLNSGNRMLKIISNKVNIYKRYSSEMPGEILEKIITEDLFYSIITPLQAVFMKFGILPPTPSEIVEETKRNLFKKKLIFKKDLEFLEKIIKLRKNFNVKKHFATYNNIYCLIKTAEKFLLKIKNIFYSKVNCANINYGLNFWQKWLITGIISIWLYISACSLRSPTMPTKEYVQYNEVFSNNGEVLDVKVNDDSVNKIEYKKPCDSNWRTINSNNFTDIMQEGCYGDATIRVYKNDVLVYEGPMIIWMGENDSDIALEKAILEIGVNPTTTEVNGIRGYIINPTDGEDGVFVESGFDAVILYWDGFGERVCNIDVQGSNSEVFNAARKQNVHDSLHGYAYFSAVMNAVDLRVQLENLKSNNWDQP